MSKNLVKKVLKIKKGEYLLEIRNNAVATTYNIEHAMDVKNWSLEQLGYIAGNLKKVGYTKTSVVDIYEDDTEEDVEGHTELPIGTDVTEPDEGQYDEGKVQVDNAGFAEGKLMAVRANGHETVLSKEQQKQFLNASEIMKKMKDSNLDISKALKSIAKRVEDAKNEGK